MIRNRKSITVRLKKLNCKTSSTSVIMYQIICVAGKKAGKAHRYAVGNYPRDKESPQKRLFSSTFWNSLQGCSTNCSTQKSKCKPLCWETDREAFFR